MDSRTARARAWDWAGEWRGSTSFWLTEVTAGGIVGWGVFLFWDNATLAGFLAAGAAAVLAFFGVFLVRWWVQFARDVQALRESVAATPAGEGRDIPGYVRKQANKMEALIPALEAADGLNARRAAWQAILSVGLTTVSGLATFDGSIADHLQGHVLRAENQVKTNLGRPDLVLEKARGLVEVTRDIRLLVG